MPATRKSKRGDFHLLQGGIDHQFAIDKTDATAARDRTAKGNVRDHHAAEAALLASMSQRISVSAESDIRTDLHFIAHVPRGRAGAEGGRETSTRVAIGGGATLT